MQWYRAERMADIIKDINIPPNAWMGVTVESKRHGRDGKPDVLQPTFA